MKNTKNKITWAITSDALTVLIDGKPCHFTRTNKAFNSLVAAIKNKDWTKLRQLADRATAVKTFMAGSVLVADGCVYYNDKPVHNLVANKIIEFMDKGMPHEPLIKFMEKLMLNPSRRAVNELYGFLEHAGLPVLPNGNVLSYKVCTSDGYDKFSHTIKYEVGKTYEMPRNAVDDDCNRTCSYGYHTGGLAYSGVGGWYWNEGDQIMICEFDPADAVSVPSNHNATKLRVCKLKIVAKYDKPMTESALYNIVGEQVVPVLETTIKTGQKVKRDSKGRFVRA
jgi:hypothetical protein